VVGIVDHMNNKGQNTRAQAQEAQPLLSTRLSKRLGLVHPILSAPMNLAAGGGLAAAVSAAGGLGIIGGGYGDAQWIEEQFVAAGNQSVGCGFITWSLRKQPELLDIALAHKPKALFLSFGDPEPFASAIKAAGVLIICQIQTRKDAERAIACGADIIVAQGSEAGGHGDKRGTITLVPEVADLIAASSPDTLLCAAGGIADGRGLIAALMLGADGVLVGSRFWASTEAIVSPRLHTAALAATGDDTIRTRTADIVRKLDWPAPFTLRALNNPFIERWHGREKELEGALDEEAVKFQEAWRSGDPKESVAIIGEAVGLIQKIEPAAEIIRQMVDQAEAQMLAVAKRQ
jgi:nitronate monooxygenase